MRRSTAGRVVTGLKLNAETGYHEATGYADGKTRDPREPRKGHGTTRDERDTLTDDSYLLGYLWGTRPEMRDRIESASRIKTATLAMTAGCFRTALGLAHGLQPNHIISALAKHGQNWLRAESLAALDRAEARC